MYCYPFAHCDSWKAELPGRDLPLGTFGEDFTIDGLSEDSIHIGDRLSIGSAEVVVTQPRLPCYKLGARFESDDMVKHFSASRRTGFYAAVTCEIEVGAGDQIRVVARDPNSVPLPWIFHLYFEKTFSADDISSARRAVAAPALLESWKEYFQERLQTASA